MCVCVCFCLLVCFLMIDHHCGEIFLYPFITIIYLWHCWIGETRGRGKLATIIIISVQSREDSTLCSHNISFIFFYIYSFIYVSVCMGSFFFVCALYIYIYIFCFVFVFFYFLSLSRNFIIDCFRCARQDLTPGSNQYTRPKETCYLAKFRQTLGREDKREDSQHGGLGNLRGVHY